MKRWLWLLAFPALIAAAPTPLVVGTVADQYGIPVPGALVQAGAARTRTDAAGTFALQASGVSSVTISCDYCQSQRVGVTPGQPVVAFVRRYDAVAQDSLTERDLESVPYSHAESIAALRPFTVLENSSRLLPGPQISDRGLSARGALLLADGIPLYDVASNQSPFVTLPAYAVQSQTLLPPSDAFLYGDLAGAGTLLAQTRSDASQDASAAAGSERAVRAGQSAADAAWSLGASQIPGDVRELAAGSVRAPFGDEALTLSALSSRDDLSRGSGLQTANGGAKLAFTSARANLVNAALTAQSGSYAGGAGYASRWSDVQLQAGISTQTRVQLFADAGARASSGSYVTSGGAIPDTAGTIAQTRIDVGARTAGDRYDVQAGVGAFGLRYGGGSRGLRTQLDGGAIVPSLSASYALDAHWSLQLQAASSFAQPTVLEAFGYPPDSPYLALDRNTFAVESLAFRDLRRFRAEITAANERVRGLDDGSVRSAGVSAAWQFAPAFSIRAWLLHENDDTKPYDELYRFGARPLPATVTSLWLTYESPGLRVDAIYRQDLRDYRPDPHLDASISAPIAPALRAFAHTERYGGMRVVSVGIQALTP